MCAIYGACVVNGVCGVCVVYVYVCVVNDVWSMVCVWCIYDDWCVCVHVWCELYVWCFVCGICVYVWRMVCVCVV